MTYRASMDRIVGRISVLFQYCQSRIHIAERGTNLHSGNCVTDRFNTFAGNGYTFGFLFILIYA